MNKLQRSFVICDPSKCIGCRLCEYACSAVKENSYSPLFSRIHMVRIAPTMSMSIACLLCENPPCVDACPRDALSVDEATGRIVVTEKVGGEPKCRGCGWCTRACKWGAIGVHSGGDFPFAKVCDLCDGDPECVKACPKEALSFVTLEEALQRIDKENLKELLNEIFSTNSPSSN